MYNVGPDVLRQIVADNDEQQIKTSVLNKDYIAADVIETTAVIAKLLLMRWPHWNKPDVDLPNKTNTLFEQWIDACKEKGKLHRARLLVTWLTAIRGHYANYQIFLFNKRMWRSKEFLHFILKDNEAPPYLGVFLFNLFRQALGYSHTELHHMSKGEFDVFAPLFKTLLTTNVVWDWAARRKQSFYFYGGQTHTFLNSYDAFFNQPTSDSQYFNREAALRYDIGGGFNTSEVERLLGCSMISADIRGPNIRDYDDDIILRTVNPLSYNYCVADDHQREKFLNRQANVVWLPFDVYKDSFPDASSYAFTSTGFITSTVRPNFNVQNENKDMKGLGTLLTSFHGLARVMEKVVQGKDVDLFTLQRASGRIYKYKTVFIQWRGGKITRLTTTDDISQGLRWTPHALDQIYIAINPENPAYLKLLD